MVGVLLVLGGVELLRFGPWSNRQQDLTPFTTTAERGVLSGVISASGELQAQQKVNVSPRQPGLLAELMVDEGDVVKRLVLAVMDRGDLDDRLQEKQALLRRADANYQNKEDFERRSQLYASGALSADDFSDARFEMLARQAGLVAARERVEQLEQESRGKGDPRPLLRNDHSALRRTGVVCDPHHSRLGHSRCHERLDR